MSENAPRTGEFHQGLLWFSRKAGLVAVGLTNKALDECGAIESLELPEEGDDFSRGDTVGSVDGANRVIEIVSPAGGFISEVNENAKKNPEIIAEDPFEEGWLFKIQIEDPTELAESED